MPNTSTFNAGIESVSHIILIVAMQFFPKKCCNCLWLYRVDGSSCKGIVHTLQIGLFGENDVCCVFRLHNAPVVR